MNSRAIVVVAFVLCGCPQPTTTTAPSASGTVTLPTVDASTVAPAADPIDAALASPDASTTPAALALFTYRENDDEFSFIEPRRIVLVRKRDGGDVRCNSELSDHGNMWTPADVIAAWTAPDMVDAVHAKKSFLSPSKLTLQGEVHAATGDVYWTPFCAGKCISGKPAVEHFLEVAHGILTNRISMCH
jgi:hypothetical protein